MQHKILIFQSSAAYDLITYLRAKDFIIIEATEDNIREKIQEKSFDAAILDGIGADNRHELIKTLRALNAKIGIIFITANAQDGDGCAALDQGADAYFYKPYDLELIASQIKALIRKSGAQAAPEIYMIGNYTLDPATRDLTIRDYSVKLPPKEMRLLIMLKEHEDQLLPKDAILRTIWQEDNYFNGRCMDVAITHLRNRLKFDANIKIENVRGKGFILRTK